MFLPTTKEELQEAGIKKLDVIIISGDSYIDSPYIGAAVIGKVLQKAGYTVGIIAQPDVNGPEDITRLGEPRLFWGVTGGSVDSMVANYTAILKRRKKDDFTPGGLNNKRPDRAVIVYSNLIRRYYKNTVPIVLGGIEASLRRVAHYDYWSDKLRKSILFNAKGDYLVYGMGERATLELAERLRQREKPDDIRGLCYISSRKPENALELPAYDEVVRSKRMFIKMFKTFYQNNDPVTAKKLCQKHDNRYLVQNPPSRTLTTEEMDEIYELDFTRELHPYYRKEGPVKALETIRFSVTSHRGCYGECNFCAITVHQGKTVSWRSERSIVNEVKEFSRHPRFKGMVADVGGPTANMYGFECRKKLLKGSCRTKRCLTPSVCPTLKTDHLPQIRLLKKLRSLPHVKKVFVASGIRYDMVLKDKAGDTYLHEILKHHISGQMKIAPEHTEDNVLKLMGKPDKNVLLKFKKKFDAFSRQTGKKQYLTYYLIAAHPGCSEKDMTALKRFTGRNLKLNPEQVQIFTPTPSTYSSLMYYTERDPFTGDKIFVEKNNGSKEKQKRTVTEFGNAKNKKPRSSKTLRGRNKQ